jgi:VanZ family protein
LRETGDPRTQWKFLAITAAAALFILYASFYPFQFSHRAGSPLRALLATGHDRASRSDVLGNVILYFPFAFFAVHTLRRRGIAVPLVTALGGACSVMVELGQFYDASRVSSIADIWANTAGSFLGALAAFALGRYTYALSPARATRNYFVLLLLGAWLGYRLFPYIPTLDLYQYKAALKPLIFSPKLSTLALYRHFATGLVVAALLAELVGPGRSRLLAPLCLLGIVCVRATIAGVVLSPAEVLGTAAAAIVWCSIVAPLRFRTPIVAALLAALIVLQSLEPFEFLAIARPFGWIPFRSFLRGSTSVNILSMFEKTLQYGGMVWLLERSGLRLPAAAAITAAAVFALRLCQVYIPGRSAEITDAAMVLLLAGVMALLRPTASGLPAADPSG